MHFNTVKKKVGGEEVVSTHISPSHPNVKNLLCVHPQNPFQKIFQKIPGVFHLQIFLKILKKNFEGAHTKFWSI